MLCICGVCVSVVCVCVSVCLSLARSLSLSLAVCLSLWLSLCRFESEQLQLSPQGNDGLTIVTRFALQAQLDILQSDALTDQEKEDIVATMQVFRMFDADGDGACALFAALPKYMP